METTIKNEELQKESEPKEKRGFVSLAMPMEKKLALQREANLVCGISVTEYCMTKIFSPTPEKQEAVIVPENEEEIKNKDLIIDELLKENKSLKDVVSKQAGEIITLKVSKSIPVIEETSTEEVSTSAISESSIVIELTPEQRAIVDMAVEFETNSFFGNEYANINHFVKKKIGDLVTSNQSSFPDKYHEKDKTEYKIAFDFIKYLKEVPNNGK